MTQESIKPLVLPRKKIVGDEAFEGDRLTRKKTADILTSYLDRLKDGAVIGIDAKWGEGKTWFGRNWAKYLQNETHKHKVVYIDAFAQDYVEDPFLLIAAEIASTLDDGKGAAKSLLKKAAKVVKAIIPTGFKVAINVAGTVALGTPNLSEGIKDAIKTGAEEATDATGKWIEEKLKNHEQEKQTLENFRIELTKFAAQQDKPVVIFIDELDRCRPTFAVQLLERIKHFFDVPNLVFVLLLNRKQMEAAIKGVYGSETEADIYLSKFIHLFLSLPKDTSLEGSDNNQLGFIKYVMSRYGFNDSQKQLVSDFSYELFQLAIALNMSLRDIEHACALFVMSNSRISGFITYLITLKIMLQSLYKRMERGDDSAHHEAIGMLEKFIRIKKIEEMNWPDIYFQCLLEIHKLHLSNGKFADMPCLSKNGFGALNIRGFNKERTFSDVFKLLDLPVQAY